MEQHRQKHGFIALVILLLTGLGCLVVARYTNTLAGEVVCVFLGVGVLVSAVSWFQMRLEDRERLEALELEELSRGGEGTRLFHGAEGDRGPARRSREMFEKYFVRAFALLLGLAQAVGGWWLWGWLFSATAAPVEHGLLAMALFGLFAFVLFLVGKFTAGLAQLEHQQLLRPAASYLLLGAYFLALVVAGLMAVQAEVSRMDLYLAQAFSVVLGVLGLETLLGLVLDLYRPRVRGQAAVPLYESRLVGLLGRPEGFFRTAAHALDYQFGFKVSETWFYRFLQQAAIWIFLSQLGLLLLSTCLVFVEAGEDALLERFGRPVPGRDLLEPGLHFKLPWPVERVHYYRTREIQGFNVGFDEEGLAQGNTLLWTVSHYRQEFHLLVATKETASDTPQPGVRRSPPVNLLSLGIPVQYQVSDVRAWAYNHDQPSTVLERLATREVVRYLVSADMQELMSVGRFPAARELRDRIQKGADDAKLGVKVLFVGLADIHPPVSVAQSYEQVVGARQNRQAALLGAEGHRTWTNALARAEALRLSRGAAAERRRLEVGALARAALFTNQLPAYLASPSVYAQRAYLETLSHGSQGNRKVVLATTNTQDVLLLNLEEKLGIDILDVPVGTQR